MTKPKRKAQQFPEFVVMTREDMERLLSASQMTVVEIILSEREGCRRLLAKHGFREAAALIRKRPALRYPEPPISRPGLTRARRTMKSPRAMAA